MRRAILSPMLGLVIAGCGASSGHARDAAPSDAGRPCALPMQIEIDLAASGTCAGPPIVMLLVDDAGAVQSVSARVPVGVTVPSIACPAPPPTFGTTACTWPLALHCQGPNGERVDLDGTLTGEGHAWASDAIAAELTGLPPARLTCAATSSATTR